MLTFDCTKYAQDSVAQTICENSSTILKVGIGVVGGLVAIREGVIVLETVLKFLEEKQFPKVSKTTKVLAVTGISLMAGSVCVVSYLAVKTFSDL